MAQEGANPLLLQWIGEWLQQARERSSKGITTYQKAYKSMQRCPLVFEHPSQASVLDGIGPNICARLTDRLTKHCQDNGLPVPPMAHKKRKGREGPGDNGGDGSGEEEEEAPAPKRVRKKKLYVPRMRSGAYAIIMALSEVESHKRGISKSAVIELAQPHCDASFTAVDPGQGKFWTAWDSMKTLLKKDLVEERKGSARTYGLTDEGWECAQGMKTTSSKSRPAAGRNGDDDGFDANFQAMQRLGEDNCGAGRPEAHARKQSRREGNNGDDDLEVEALPVSRGQTNPWLRHDDGFVDRLEAMQQCAEVYDRGPVRSKPCARRGSQFVRDNDADGSQQIDPSPELPRAAQAARPRGQTAQATEPPPTPFADVVPPDNPSDIESVPRFTAIVLQPGTFTVHLVLDNREILSRRDRDYIENELLKLGVTPIKRNLELGDALWIAKLKDPNYLSKFGAEGDEVMLDHIVERKRLDDLISSIKDGRYDEQKFRLIKSGVKNVSYIIEEISLAQEHGGRYEEAIQSAMASMQVVHGFFVKITSKMDETIGHLARTTKLLKGIYEEKALRVIPTRHITASNYPRLRAHLREKEAGTDYHITYQAFASLGSKSETLTLRDVFLKMLLCTNGITPERALAIQQRWKTPYAFVKAYAALGDGMQGDKKKREFMKEQFGHAVTNKKKIGKPASWRLAAVWADVGET